MRVKMLIFLLVSILSVCLIGCSNINQDDGTTKNTSTNEPSNSTVKEKDRKVNSSTSTANVVVKENNNIILTNTSKPFIGKMDLDSETEKFFYGTWKVEKLLGFANSWNDDSEYPTGQKIIDDEIIINKDFFSSVELKNYKGYQYELKNPSYIITEIYYNREFFYRMNKIDIPGLDLDDEVKVVEVASCPSEMSIPMRFFVVNNDRLILMIEATIFELNM